MSVAVTAEQAQPEPGPEPGLVPLRFVTAASLFDGHDAAINVMRRLIQDRGAEVIHLGHNRSVSEIVRAAIQEDADAIAVSSYQGGHMEFFRYTLELLRERGAGHILVFGGGGGTITPAEIAELERDGVARLYHPNDGMALGLGGMIDDLMARARGGLGARAAGEGRPARPESDADQKPWMKWLKNEPQSPKLPLADLTVARALSALEDGVLDEEALRRLRGEWAAAPRRAPVVGITGTGGAGKSTVTDELLHRFSEALPDLHVAIIAVDPTRRRTGGALLGDRIRMNSLRNERIYMRSVATRASNRSTSAMLADAVAFLRSAAGFDLVIVETAGTGQGDSEVVDHVDIPVYVMTSEFGAASQLEKIDMLDLAELVVINKSDRPGASDALRDVRKQWRRNHAAFELRDEQIPVHPTVASQFADPGVTRLFEDLCQRIGRLPGAEAAVWERQPAASGPEPASGLEPASEPERERPPAGLIPAARTRYLAEIAEQGRAVNAAVEHAARRAAQAQAYLEAARALGADSPAADELSRRAEEALAELGDEARALLERWDERIAGITAETYSYTVRGREVTGDNHSRSLSGLRIPKLAPPRLDGWGDRLRFLLKENLPGHYPYTGGVYPYRRAGEDPTRMFAGEGTPERTNRRFHYLSAGQPAARLSTAFDSVTLYGADPHERPDIFGKVGNSGVSVATIDDAKKLYSGFDLCDPATSVSMTINGPAPIILAFFMNAAIDQQVERHLRETGTPIPEPLARYSGELPAGSDGLGLALLGRSGEELVERDVYERIKAETLRTVRGTVQADILKEDQAQNTCISSTEFAMRMMGDVQQYFIDHGVRNFYSVSISGYHIAEAGANPITQLAFTLANGFTIVEYYRSRGMAVEDFATNLSFFFSNGMDPEYAVIGRVARRIWARAMRERYGASPRSQMLKYHIQTSGRSLHAQEISFNDIRTTLQALYALLDNCNSLHTNAYDEAITTPTEESVRRAMAIQLIINRELGLNQTENALQGSFIVSELTDLVEEAVYAEFERLSERGGVLGAMETMYQRSKIQEESLHYERLKHSGELPLIGVNTFLPREGHGERIDELELIRSTDEEKRQQISNLRAFQQRGARERPAALARLKDTARSGGNVFESLLEAVKHASLGQVTDALYAVGGEYRRNM